MKNDFAPKTKKRTPLRGLSKSICNARPLECGSFSLFTKKRPATENCLMAFFEICGAVFVRENQTKCDCVSPSFINFPLILPKFNFTSQNQIPITIFFIYKSVRCYCFELSQNDILGGGMFGCQIKASKGGLYSGRLYWGRG